MCVCARAHARARDARRLDSPLNKYRVSCMSE